MIFRKILILLLALCAAPALAGQATVGGSDLVLGSSERVDHKLPAADTAPMVVRTTLAFIAIDEYNEQAGTFHATIDLRTAWSDDAASYPAESGSKPRTYIDWLAGQELFKIWTPRIRLSNIDGKPTFIRRLLTIAPDGRVEVLTRLSANFKAPADIARYPFDEQKLPVEITAYGDEAQSLQLAYGKDDTAFANQMPAEELDGWEFKPVLLAGGLSEGWEGQRYSQVIATMQVKRVSAEAIVALCLPLLASLLIPFLVIWLNRSNEEEFEVEAFELANVVIGGLFAVIALSITLSSSNPALVVKDNVVSRLLMLNYVSLGFGIFIVLFLYQFRLVGKWFGEKAQRMIHLSLCWAYPILTTIVAIAILTGPLWK